MAGISLILQNNPTITSINCGTSSPRLGGTIDLTNFSGLKEFVCILNDITSCDGYSNNSNLENLQIFDNKITGSLPNFNNLTGLKSLNCSLNLLSGTIPNLSNNKNLQFFFVNNQIGTSRISGSIPSLTGNPELLYFWCNNNQITGSIPTLSNNTKLFSFHCATNLISGSVPALPSNIKEFRCNQNQITGFLRPFSETPTIKIIHYGENLFSGAIPILTQNSLLEEIYLHDNFLSGSIPNFIFTPNLNTFMCYRQEGLRLTGWLGGTIPQSLGNFHAYTIGLQTVPIDNLLRAFRNAGRNIGVRYLQLDGSGNSSPTSGINNPDKRFLETGLGWTVLINP